MGQTQGPRRIWGAGGLAGKETFMPCGQDHSGKDLRALDSGPHSEFYFLVGVYGIHHLPFSQLLATNKSCQTEIRN